MPVEVWKSGILRQAQRIPGDDILLPLDDIKYILVVHVCTDEVMPDSHAPVVIVLDVAIKRF